MHTKLLSVFLLLCLSATAQNKYRIYGTVTGTEPLSGATIMLQKAKTTTQSKPNGSFSIETVFSTDTLLVSYTGYLTQAIAVNSNTVMPLTIILQPAAQTLNEVVVSTGYQELPKERSTGSFYKLDNKLLNQQVSTNILSRINDLTSGLLVDARSTQNNYLIRGLSTLNNATLQPLIILDNFPYNGNLNNINPNDVESITVLKDAAATSIWGARAGNGVIVITTKKAKAGQPLQVTFNSNINIMPAPDLFSAPQLSVNSTIELETFLFNKGYYNGLFNSVSRPAISQIVEILQQQKNGSITAEQATAQINTLRGYDLRSQLQRYIYRTAVNRQYALNLSGAAERIRYLFSAGFDQNTAEQFGNNNNRITLRTDNTFDLTKNWSFTAGSILTHTNICNNSPGDFNFFTAATGGLSPYAQLADANGLPLAVDPVYRSVFTDTAGMGRLLNWKYRPLEELQLADNTTRSFDYLLNLGTQYKINGWLSAAVNYQLQQSFTQQRQYNSIESYFTRDLVNRYTQLGPANTATYSIPKEGILRTNENTNKAWSWRAQLNANKQWGTQHTLNAIAGYEVRETVSAQTTANSYGYNQNTLSNTPVDFTRAYPTYAAVRGNAFIPNNTNFNLYNNRFVSAYANAAYSFQKKYILSASVRKDASNLFGVQTNQKGVPLWSAGMQWKLSDEAFYKNKLLPRLNLRFTYGFSGNLDPSASALTRIVYEGAPSSPINIPAVRIAAPPNPALRWERVEQWNTAIDFATANNRITGSVEYYQKYSFDLFNDVNLNPTVGFTSVRQNSAAIKGSGFDVVINSANTTGAVKWNSLLLLSYATYKVTRNLAPPTTDGYAGDGKIIFPLLGYHPYLVTSYQWAGLDPLTGDPQGYLNGTLSKDYNAMRSNSIEQQVIHGAALPPVFGTIRNTLQWKALTLAVNITYKLGHFVRKPSLNYTSLFQTAKGHPQYEQRWQQPGDEVRTNVPSMIYPAVSLRDNFYNNASINVINAGHIRLKDIFCSYDLPLPKNQKLLSAAQLYAFSSQLNILLWKANKNNLDPERLSSLKPAVSYAAGLKLNFR